MALTTAQAATLHAAVDAIPVSDVDVPALQAQLAAAEATITQQAAAIETLTLQSAALATKLSVARSDAVSLIAGIDA